MGHMETVAELITERDIDCLEHLTDVTCREFEGGTGFKLRFTFDIKTNKYFTDQLFIKRYEVPNILLEDEPILKNLRCCNVNWKEGRRLTYRDVKKKQRSKSSGRVGQICTVRLVASIVHDALPISSLGTCGKGKPTPRCLPPRRCCLCLTLFPTVQSPCRR